MSALEVRLRIDLPTAIPVFWRCLPPQHVGRHQALGEQGVDHEAVAGMDDGLAAQVDHGHGAAQGGAAPELGDEGLVLGRVEVDPLLHVRQPENLVDAVALAGVDQLHHQLVVGDPELPGTGPARCGCP